MLIGSSLCWGLLTRESETLATVSLGLRRGLLSRSAVWSSGKDGSTYGEPLPYKFAVQATYGLTAPDLDTRALTARPVTGRLCRHGAHFLSSA